MVGVNRLSFDLAPGTQQELGRNLRVINHTDMVIHVLFHGIINNHERQIDLRYNPYGVEQKRIHVFSRNVTTIAIRRPDESTFEFDNLRD